MQKFIWFFKSVLTTYLVGLVLGFFGPLALNLWKAFDSANITWQKYFLNVINVAQMLPPLDLVFKPQGGTLLQSVKELGVQAPAYGANILKIFDPSVVGAFVLLILVVYLVIQAYQGNLGSTLGSWGGDVAKNLTNLATLTMLGVVGAVGLIVFQAWSWGQAKFLVATYQILPVAITMIALVAVINYMKTGGLLQGIFNIVLIGLLMMGAISLISGKPVVQDNVTFTIPTNTVSAYFAGLTSDWSGNAFLIATELFVACLSGIIRMLFVSGKSLSKEHK